MEYAMNTIRKIIYYLIKGLSNKHKATWFYLKPYLRTVENEIKNFDCNGKHSDRVWTMWLQEDVPELMQACIDTIKKHHPNVTIITNKNIYDFIDMPKHMKEKFENNTIPHPHFSDYVRCYLLDKYGGLWIDASCYMFDKVPEFITKQDFFILTEPSLKAISSFFIYSKNNNYIIKAMRIFLEQYWKNENTTINYFFFHHFFRLLCYKNAFCKNYFDNMQHWENAQVRYFVDHPRANYNPDLWNYLAKSGFMYKINRKDEYAMANPNGFYQHILNLHRAAK